MLFVVQNAVAAVGRKNPLVALTDEIITELAYLSTHFSLTDQYETLTKLAKAVFDAPTLRWNDFRKLGAHRAALNYVPPSGFTIESGRTQLEALRTKVEQRQQSHLDALQGAENIDYVVACTDCLNEIRNLTESKCPTWPPVPQAALAAVGLKDPSAALTDVLLSELRFLEEHCSKTVQFEILVQKQKVAQKNRKTSESKAIFEQRTALRYTPPGGFTVTSARTRLDTLRINVTQRRQALGFSMHAPEHIDYIVACTDCLQKLEGHLNECSAAPHANMQQQISTSELRTISWADLTAETSNCVLGTGSFGRVFHLLWQQSRDKVHPVAVKVMSQTFARYANLDYTAALAMAKQEAKTIHEISVRGGDAMSTHVIQVYGFVQGPLPATLTSAFKGARAGEEAYGIVMRLEAGGSLKQLLHPDPGKPKTPLSTEERIRLLALAARGLTELHRIGTVHADLKPDNILLSIKNPPDVRIADFGLSVIREQMIGSNTNTTASVQRTGTVAGTKLYNAPEMLLSNSDAEGNVARASRSTDIFAFGIVIHEVLSGTEPYEGQTDITEHNFENKISQGARPLTSLLPSDTPLSLIKLLEKCWDGDRANRPTAAECLATITHAHSVLESKEFDIFYSHRWGDPKNKKFLTYVCFLLRREGYHAWFDVDYMGFDLEASMKGGVARSKVVVACVDSGYQDRPNCMLELRHARSLSPPKTVVTVITQPDIMTWGSPELKSLCGVPGKAVLDISGSAALDGWDALDGPTDAMKSRVEQEVKELVKMLKAVGCEPSL